MSLSNVTERFLTCLDELVKSGMVKSKRHFALSVGYHPQGISEMTARRRDVPLELIEKAVDIYRFNPLFLFTGQGQPFTSTIEDEGFRLKNLMIVTNQKGEERIVHVPFPAQAGYGAQLDDPVFISELPSYQLPDPQFRSGTYRSFEIAGSSMEPSFKAGDIVIAAFIEPRYWQQAIKNGQVYIIVTHQEVVIKRINNFLKADKKIECCSDNTEFESYPIPADQIREVWKARVKMTTYLDAPSTTLNSMDIRQQLQVQHKMLEHLQFQLNNAKVS